LLDRMLGSWSRATLRQYPLLQKVAQTLVFCGESRRDSKFPLAVEKLPRVNASRFQFEANCMHAVKLKRVAMQP
jgi:hypothetical protein